MDDREYMRQRSAIWQVYSDRGYFDQIAWLESERDRYKKKLENINDFIIEKRKEKQARGYAKKQAKRKRTANIRRYRKRIRKRELEERWEKYGLK